MSVMERRTSLVLLQALLSSQRTHCFIQVLRNPVPPRTLVAQFRKRHRLAEPRGNARRPQ